MNFIQAKFKPYEPPTRVIEAYFLAGLSGYSYWTRVFTSDSTTLNQWSPDDIDGEVWWPTKIGLLDGRVPADAVVDCIYDIMKYLPAEWKKEAGLSRFRLWLPEFLIENINSSIDALESLEK